MVMLFIYMNVTVLYNAGIKKLWKLHLHLTFLRKSGNKFCKMPWSYVLMLVMRMPALLSSYWMRTVDITLWKSMPGYKWNIRSLKKPLGKHLIVCRHLLIILSLQNQTFIIHVFLKIFWQFSWRENIVPQIARNTTLS